MGQFEWSWEVFCDFVRGNGLQKKDFQDIGVPVFTMDRYILTMELKTDVTISFVSSELSQKLKKAKTGDLIVMTTSENVEDVGKAVWFGEEEVCIGGHSRIIKLNKIVNFSLRF